MLANENGCLRVRRGVRSYIGAAVQVAIDRNLRLLHMPDRIYLDHAATTPILPEARDALARGVEHWANPSSPHGEGRAANALLEEARHAIADALGWRHDVIFTSGASEAIEIAAARANVEGRAHGATEHAIVPFAMGSESEVIPVDSDGLIDEGVLDELLIRGPALVAIQHVNNETGVIQPLVRIGPKIRAAGSLLLADCAQSAGKLPAISGGTFIALMTSLAFILPDEHALPADTAMPARSNCTSKDALDAPGSATAPIVAMRGDSSATTIAPDRLTPASSQRRSAASFSKSYGFAASAAAKASAAGMSCVPRR